MLYAAAQAGMACLHECVHARIWAVGIRVLNCVVVWLQEMEELHDALQSRQPHGGAARRATGNGA